MIALIGHLEKRVAFYVPDAGSLTEGQILELSIPLWQGCANVVREVDGKRFALVDAEQILERYLDLTRGIDAEGVSGGATRDDSQAASMADAQAPPDIFAPAEEGSETDVLVVEQSDSVRNALSDILNDDRCRVTYTTGLDEALEFIVAARPRLIISEFRMPSMAAKALIDTLGQNEMSVPVLVTTSQSGQTAETLAKKLGAAGYLSKPLNREDVAERVNGIMGNGFHFS
jgi:CheY-like chemotaxis protein